MSRAKQIASLLKKTGGKLIKTKHVGEVVDRSEIDPVKAIDAYQMRAFDSAARSLEEAGWIITSQDGFLIGVEPDGQASEEQAPYIKDKLVRLTKKLAATRKAIRTTKDCLGQQMLPGFE